MPRPPEPLATFLDRIVFAFASIERARESLGASLTFLGYQESPTGEHHGTGYSTYHIDHWLSSTYVLAERTRTYLVRGSRYYRRESAAREAFTSAAEKLHGVVTGHVGDLFTDRGRLVHEAPLVYSGISRLTGLEIGGRAVGRLVPSFEVHLAAAVAVWRERIATANSQLDDVLDEIFGPLVAVAFRPDGGARFPVRRA